MAENLQDLLRGELREAVAARIADGADLDEIAGELAWRLRRIKQLQKDDGRLHPDPSPPAS
ncbi:hypothetical protein ACIBD9_04085 [Micromonospora sp. NPDC050784]|uniref:hypothetical protein n=1 Tax=Micromonospora sp. NPDC050784 TaxID=3364281 RepID=UPI003794BF64